MRSFIIFLFCAVLGLLPFVGHAQIIDSVKIDTLNQTPTKQISLLTCGVGAELYSSFGHTAIRVKDLKTHKDIVYNYGTFNYNDSLFYVKFTLGKLEYYLARDYYEDFVSMYKMEGRSVKEQVLNISNEEAEQIYHYLEHNALPQNRSYKYDFIYDNCATRVRDVFENALGTSFRYADVVGDKKVSYRSIINEYLANNHWSRWGINILLGSNIDSSMNKRSALFLPELLFAALDKGKLGPQAVVGKNNLIIEGKAAETTPNIPLYMGIAILVIAMIVFNVKSMERIRIPFSRCILFLMGLIGVLILFMWLATDHQACANNYNILWAVPTHLIVAFLPYKGKLWSRMYALASMSLLIVAILVHILGLQVMPLIELLPWFVMLMLIYADMYKVSRKPTAVDNKTVSN